MPRQIRRVLVLSVMTLMLARSGTARAEWSPGESPGRLRPPTGLYLSAGHAITIIPSRWENGFLRHGIGFRLTAGIRFSRHFGLEFNWQRTYHQAGYDIIQPTSNPRLNAYAVDAKLYPSGRGPAQFYFVGGGGAYTLRGQDTPLLRGLGFQVGAGVDFWLSSRIKLGFQGQYRRVTFLDTAGPSGWGLVLREVATSSEGRNRVRLNTASALVEFTLRI